MDLIARIGVASNGSATAKNFVIGMCSDNSNSFSHLVSAIFEQSV